MTELEMIAEWRKGCSCASKEHPEECTACTRGLVDALEAKLRAATPPAAKGTTEGYKATFRDGEFEQVCAALAQQPAAQAAGLTDDEIERLISRFIGNVAPGLRNDCRALVLEVLSRAAPSGEEWQPIETAPKDGYAFLALLPDSDIAQPIWYDDGKWRHKWDNYILKAADQPTHWMPLPQGRSAQHADPNAGEVERMLDADEQPAEEARGVDDHALASRWNRIANSDDQRAAFMAEVRALLAAPAAGTGQHPVIGMLIEVARCAFLALDHSEEREGPDGREHALDAQSFDDLSDALDALDGLPDDQPGVTMGPAQKAEWALRTVAATGAQGLTWISVNDRLPPIGTGERVLIYTEGADFAGEQFFDIKADDLYPTPDGEQDARTEVAAAATHWMPLPYPGITPNQKDA